MEECKFCETPMSYILHTLNDGLCYACKFQKRSAQRLYEELKGEFSRLDCRKALMRSDGEFEKAKEWLRNMDTSGRLITRGRDDLNGRTDT
ncbi:putative translation elongation factor [Bacillus phage Kirov]|uniref:Putative translation elongation factor n=1 Tax=Bacillus phage Kirov TaxID=2783539 RepID=A0A7U3NKP1_9CAUD|nr:putative translation elongation factor [Bacillus phage Kirov]QOV08409.1 putative translation elongation factor [Bacillus phage Kirov]